MPDKPPAGYWSWREKAQAAYKKQLAPKDGTFWDDAPKRKTAPKDKVSA